MAEVIENNKESLLEDDVSEDEVDEEFVAGGDFLGVEGDSSEEENEFERQARELEEQQSLDAKEAHEELMTNITDREQVKLPSSAESSLLSTDLKTIQQRIQDILFVLANFNENREEGKSRSQYIAQISSDVSAYYGYSDELASKFLELFTPAEAIQFFEANEKPRPITIRVNSLKTRKRELSQKLMNRGVQLDSIGDWTNVGLKVYNSQVPLGATPEYLSGHYMLQSASSLMPVIALDVQENQRILDMSAAPGGKASHVAANMKNTGVLIVNDVSKVRQKATIGNFHRLGVRNAVITNYDGKDLPKHFSKLNRVLLDAPCTGLGIIARDPSIKIEKKVDDIFKCAKLQKELILAGIDMLEVGGIIVYSTCSVTVEENEDVIAYALRKRHIRIVDTGLEFGVEGFYRWRDKRFPEEMKLTRRYYPHVHNMDGFFVAKLEKIANGAKKLNTEEESSGDKRNRAEESSNQKNKSSGSKKAKSSAMGKYPRKQSPKKK